MKPFPSKEIGIKLAAVLSARINRKLTIQCLPVYPDVMERHIMGVAFHVTPSSRYDAGPSIQLNLPTFSQKRNL